MALRHAVLATLLDAEASGYELAKRFDASVANFWHALPQQIYGELRRLEQQRLIRGRTVRQQGRPDKRVFTITKAGKHVLREFAAAPTKPGALKEDLAVKIYSAAVADPESLILALNQRAAHSAAKLERYQRQADALADPDGSDLGPSLTLTRGIAYERENIAWCAIAAERLRRHAGRADHTQLTSS
jgi:DNA-binding PadR family transcriptional regulator